MIKALINFFSPYAHPFEKKVDVFLKNLRSDSSKIIINDKLNALLQENAAILSVWLEKKYHNYYYLSKDGRKLLYQNLQIIENAFVQTLKGNENQKEYLEKIMDFLKPNRRFYYEASSSFGKLLRDPDKMIGDCNQIVTFYIFLFSRKFSIDDLQIKLLPEHVCLHFAGKDIEATAGTYQEYLDFEYILPVTEIVSTNLLDIADFREMKKSIATRDLLKSAQLAYLLSSLREIVTKNLNASLVKVALELAKNHDFEDACYFVDQVSEPLRKRIYANIAHNAVVFFVNKNNFSKAKFFAKKTVNSKLDRYILEHEFRFFIQKFNYDKARSIANFLGNEQLIKSSYEQEYFNLAKKVKNIKKITEAKNHKQTYLKLLKLAKSACRDDLEVWPKKILKQISEYSYVRFR